MASASCEHPGKGATHTNDTTGLDDANTNSLSEEEELVRKWNGCKARMISLNAKMDVLQTRIEAIEERLLTFEFPEKRVRANKPEVPCSDIVVIGYCARQNKEI